MKVLPLEISRNDAGKSQFILSNMLNRHGLIAGATGTGKTVTLRTIAEQCSDLGIPVFLVDVKGDLSGIKDSGQNSGKIGERMQTFRLPENRLKGYPVRFWDIFGQTGIPIRVTISQMGPMLLARLLKLNDTQTGLLNLVFKVCDDKGWHLIDLKDLRGMLKYLSDNATQYRVEYGNISAASIGAIQRQLLQLENSTGLSLFGEPALDLDDLLQTEGTQGIINILNAEQLINSRSVFSAFLLWLLAELFERLPEVGDSSKPKFVLFFDEAHLLFDNAPDALIEQVEQVVRLIRSKGVGVYFCTQNPADLPNSILGQLGNRVQHALRAFTPHDQKAIKVAAQTFRINPNINVEQVISQLGVGEALVSFLDEKGIPNPVERTWILPPCSSLTPLSKDRLSQCFRTDHLYPVYKDSIDNYSAYEALLELEKNHAQEDNQNPSLFDGFLTGLFGNRKKQNAGLGYNVSNQIGRSISRQITNQISKAITRGILGALGGRK